MINPFGSDETIFGFMYSTWIAQIRFSDKIFLKSNQQWSSTHSRYLLNGDGILDEGGKVKRQHFWFLGILLGVAVRTKKPIALSLAPLVWKLLANCQTGFKDLEDVDFHYAKSLRILFECQEVTSFEHSVPTDEFAGITFTGRQVSLASSPNTKLTFANRHSYVARAVSQRLEVMYNKTTHFK